ncbi:hypothetical protein T265_14259, partial [Opisthorchis viverrini]
MFEIPLALLTKEHGRKHKKNVQSIVAKGLQEKSPDQRFHLAKMHPSFRKNVRYGSTSVKIRNRRRDKQCVDSTRTPLYRKPSGASMVDKPSPYEIGQEFGTLAGPASRRDLIGRQSGPNSQS